MPSEVPKFEKLKKGGLEKSEGEVNEIPKKYSEIVKLGFSDQKAIEYLSFNFKLETLKEKIKDLQKAGFSDPVSSIERSPQLAGYDIKRVINDLKEAGFSNPVSSIEKFPRLAGYDIERVINDLRKAGFSNPVSLIERYPQLAGRDIERIKRRLGFIKKLNRIFNLDYDPIKIIETFPRYLGYRQSRLFFYLRIAAFYNLDEKFYKSRLIRRNPYLVFSRLLEELPLDRQQLGKVLISLSEIPENEKEEKIKEVKENLPSFLENLQKQPKETRGRDLLLKLARTLIRLAEEEKKEKEKIKRKTK